MVSDGPPGAGRTALVTAGAKGLGRAIRDALLEAGYRVAFTTREAASSPDPPGARRAVTALATPAEAEALVRELLALWGRVDVLVNNLGPDLDAAVAETTVDDLEAVVHSNLVVPFRLVTAVIPAMRRQGGGAVINLGAPGAATARGLRHRGAYAAAKSALASLTRTIAREEAPHGIQAMMVSPGRIRDADKEVGRIPPSRPRDPVGGDVARLVVFLADPASYYLSGNVVDLMRRPRAPSS